MPPCPGAGNSCDSSCSPSTSRSPSAWRPAGSLSNCARPWASVFVVCTSEPTCSSTVWFAMLFVIAPRMTRTDTEPFGRSSTGRGIPAICRGSGWAWSGAAINSAATTKTPPRRTRRTHENTDGTQFASVSSGRASVVEFSGSQFVPAVLTEPRVGLVLRAAVGAEIAGGDDLPGLPAPAEPAPLANRFARSRSICSR